MMKKMKYAKIKGMPRGKLGKKMPDVKMPDLDLDMKGNFKKGVKDVRKRLK